MEKLNYPLVHDEDNRKLDVAKTLSNKSDTRMSIAIDDLLTMEIGDFIACHSSENTAGKDIRCLYRNNDMYTQKKEDLYEDNIELYGLENTMRNYSCNNLHSNIAFEKYTGQWINDVVVAQQTTTNIKHRLPDRQSEGYSIAENYYGNNDDSFKIKRRCINTTDSNLADFYFNHVNDDLKAELTLSWIENNNMIVEPSDYGYARNNGGATRIVSSYHKTQPCSSNWDNEKETSTFPIDIVTSGNMLDYTNVQSDNDMDVSSNLNITSPYALETATEIEAPTNCSTYSIISDCTSNPYQCQSNAGTTMGPFQTMVFPPFIGAKFPTSWTILLQEWTDQGMDTYLKDGIRSRWVMTDQQRYSKRYRGIKMIKRIAKSLSVDEQAAVIKLDTDRGSMSCSNHLLALEKTDKSIQRRKSFNSNPTSTTIPNENEKDKKKRQTEK
jgi:hypothetical protein